MFDVVFVPCPDCGEESEFQIKGGGCDMKYHILSDCPEDVLLDINRHSPNKCDNCGIEYEVDIDNSCVRSICGDYIMDFERKKDSVSQVAIKFAIYLLSKGVSKKFTGKIGYYEDGSYMPVEYDLLRGDLIQNGEEMFNEFINHGVNSSSR